MTKISQKHNEECKGILINVCVCVYYLLLMFIIFIIRILIVPFVEFCDKIEEREKRIKELETLEDKYKKLTEAHVTLKYNYDLYNYYYTILSLSLSFFSFSTYMNIRNQFKLSTQHTCKYMYMHQKNY